MDYCDQPHEREANPEAAYWIDQVAAGDPHVADFCRKIWNFEHCLDDLIDGDKPVSQEQVARAVCDLVQVLTLNPFYLAHREQLFGLLVSCMNRWIEGDALRASEDATERAQGVAVSCADLDLLCHVAFLRGGWDHMRAMRGLRSFDKEAS